MVPVALGAPVVTLWCTDSPGTPASSVVIVAGGGTTCDTSTGNTLLVVPKNSTHSRTTSGLTVATMTTACHPNTCTRCCAAGKSLTRHSARDVTGSGLPMAIGISSGRPHHFDHRTSDTISGASMVAGGGATCDASVGCTFGASCKEAHVMVLSSGSTPSHGVATFPEAFSEAGVTASPLAIAVTCSAVTCSYSNTFRTCCACYWRVQGSSGKVICYQFSVISNQS